jgi:hypothetical protein
MPRFMGFVRMEENIGMPPQSLFDAMDVYIGERAASGVFLDGGGLFGTEDAVNFVVRKGDPTLEEAVADQQKFAELHAEHWPEVTVVSTLRQISDGPDAPTD